MVRSVWPLAAVAASTSGVLLFCSPVGVVRLGFESGDFGGWDTRKLVKPYSGRVVSDPVRAGRYAARFELHAGDFVSDGIRAELKEAWNAPLRQEIWYSFSTFVPAGFPTVSKPCVLAQWHDQADEGEVARSPYMAHRYDGRTFFVDIRSSPVKIQKANDGVHKTIFETTSFSRDRWHDFLYRVRWSHGADGYVDGWLDGQQVIAYAGPVGYNDDRGPYFKFGLYHHEGSMPYVVYHDEYRHGPRREDVAVIP